MTERLTVRLGLVLLALYAVFTLPGLVAALFVYGEIGSLRLAFDAPLWRAWPTLHVLDPAVIWALPVFEIDLAARMPVERSYAVTLTQVVLSVGLAVLMGLAWARAIETNRASLMVLAAFGLVIAVGPGLLGHCVGTDQSGGLFMLLGMAPETARQWAGLSPWIQAGYGVLLAAALWRTTGSRNALHLERNEALPLPS